MSDQIVFLAQYPDETNIMDGMMQRIKNVDNYFLGLSRTYLQVSLVNNRRYTATTNGELTIVRLNLFLHIRTVLRLLKRSKYLYFHSLWNFLPLTFFSLKNKRIVLDLHGVVPEELDFYNRKSLSKLFGWSEKIVMRKVNALIYVNRAMQHFYGTKYPYLLQRENYVCPLIAGEDEEKSVSFDEAAFRKEIGIREEDVVFIYSGNIQKWQNFDLVLDLVKNLDNLAYKFLFLSRDIAGIQKLMQEKGMELHADRYKFFTVKPENLYKYYSIAHYGFVLRDDHILNRVATPTKLLEYINYGIIPIVKLDEIGDFKSKGYEYIPMTGLNNNMMKAKSELNQQIFLDLKNETNLNIKNIALR
ncbi:MAG: hypothetical protein JO154_17260 [Chitinophaga sp.]|uniref:hypothetical protein n=1 Tax=Chitinophaga sp. TaxID=1869181 RepID=UPI0025BFCBB1|nr:hypothetical protein [Chitinophaga sp.]MBV8254351.1 hypothetical protein [Chitinophaga sp.]